MADCLETALIETTNYEDLQNFETNTMKTEMSLK